jgi:hypothetical protein
MAIKIGDTAMTSETTGHSARHLPSGAWRVTWLPGSDLNRNEAITAMTLAETVANRPVTTEDRLWPHIEGWAAELGMGAEAAILGVRQPPAEQPQRQG